MEIGLELRCAAAYIPGAIAELRAQQERYAATVGRVAFFQQTCPEQSFEYDASAVSVRLQIPRLRPAAILALQGQQPSGIGT